MTDPLAFARALIAQGVPVFVAPPDAAHPVGFRLPTGWQASKATPRALDDWQPGWAVAALGGHGLDVIDVDPRNGGDVAAAKLRAEGKWPREYAIVATPSGGTHHYIYGLGAAKTKRDGIDLQAGAPDGTGRGFVFLPGTERTSKVDGVSRGYMLAVDRLDTFGSNDSSGAGFLAWVQAGSNATSVPGGAKSHDLGGSGPTALERFSDPVPAGTHDEEGARLAASLARLGFTRDDALAVLRVRVSRFVGGDPRNPFTDRDLDRWWAGAQKFAGAPAVQLEYDPVTGELDPFASAVASEVARLRVIEHAREQLATERADREFRDPPRATLADALKLPDETVSYAIRDLLPSGGNAVLTAAFKAGKTTMMVNLIRSLVDGEPFLGQFAVAPTTVAVWDYELSPGQHRRWLRQAMIQHTERAHVVNLRGHRVDVTTPRGEDWAVRTLADTGATAWIVDPYGRALAGADENDNSAVGRFLEALDVVKERAGISELIMPAHTGRKIHEQGAEHARGATRLDDWADARWILTREPNNQRFFRADGRDVDLEEKAVLFEFGTLSLADWDRGDMKERAFEQAVRPKVAVYIREHPGCVTNRITDALPHNVNDVRRAIRELEESGDITITDGPGKSRQHWEAKKNAGHAE